jgi:hypothetical protein
MKKKKLCVRHSLCWLVCVFCTMFLGACVTSGGGASRALQRSLEVEATFQAGTIVPDHTYFIQGTNSEPEAIIALSNSFQLQSRLWEKVEWTQKELDTVVFWMQNAELGFCSTDGGYLVAQDGERLGLWYSKRDLTVIKGPTAGVVEIYPFKFMSSSPCQRQHLRDKL